MFAVLATVAALSAPAAAGVAKPPPTAARSWAQPEIRAVTAQGLLGGDPNVFRPDDALTRGELAELVAGMTGATASAPARPDDPVTLVGLDAALVRALGLADVAAGLQRTARAAGLAPPRRFGGEVVARLLGLRTNHPAAQDALELLPNDPVTRAEAAYSAARALRLDETSLEAARTTLATFVPDALTPWQQRVLATAVSFVGFPYVWGGESERSTGATGPYGPQAQGGFDCSGFVWRVFKLQPYVDGPTLATTLRGRTTYELSGEIPRAARIPFARLAPGDVAFFGAGGRRSRPAQVDHAGIYVGGGWIVHASSQGVTLVPLTGWFRDRFAWGRRPLSEAGLENTR
jgi:cell wall-associated NlpC family hydrolase